MRECASRQQAGDEEYEPEEQVLIDELESDLKIGKADKAYHILTKLDDAKRSRTPTHSQSPEILWKSSAIRPSLLLGERRREENAARNLAMSDDEDSSSDEDEEKAPGAAGYPMMMSYGYAACLISDHGTRLRCRSTSTGKYNAYSYAAYAQAYPGYAASYPGYGTGDYSAYMQQMSAAGYTPGFAGAGASGTPSTPGIATDPMTSYYGAAGVEVGCRSSEASSSNYGTVKTFLAEKGFGFIESAVPSEGDVFFSKTELSPDLQAAESNKELKGKPVQFEITIGKDGRSRAANVQLCSLESWMEGSFSERHGYGFVALENDAGDAQFRGSDLSPELAALGSALAGRMVKCHIHELADGKYKATEIVPIPGQAGKGKSSGKGKTQALQRVKGKVKAFDPDTRMGTLSCSEKSEVHFFDLKNLQLEEGAEARVLASFFCTGIVVSKLDSCALKFLPGSGRAPKAAIHLLNHKSLWAPMLGKKPTTNELHGQLVQLQALEGGPFHDFTNKAGLVVRDQSQQLFYKVNVGQHHLPIEPHQLHVIRDQIAPMFERSSSSTRGWQLGSPLGHAPSFRGIPDGSVEFQILLELVGDMLSNYLTQSREEIIFEQVSFLLKDLADGSAQGMDLCLGDSDPSTVEPFSLRDGTTITATVKSFNETRGFGFLKIPGANMDLYFHGRDTRHLELRVGSCGLVELQDDLTQDMDEASQGLLMLVGGAGLANCIATCRVEARADGRWNGRTGNVSLLESGVQMLDGMKMAGMIRYFYDYKGFGFINVTGNPIDIYFQGRDVGPDAQMRCEEMGPVGTVVLCREQPLCSSGWQAKEIVLAGDGSSPGGLTAEMLGGKGWGKGDSWLNRAPQDGDGWDSYGWDGWGSMDYGGGKGCGKGKSSLPKVEKQIIPGCELVGRLKSYNAEKNFGFISVEGQTNDVYFQVWDLVESLKSQLDSVGPEGSGLTPGALVKFWLQLMPGGGRLRARDLSLSPATAEGPSAAATVDAAVQKAAVVAHEAIIPGTGSILYDGAEDRGFGFISVDADETDLYFNVKDMHPEDQKKVANGLRLPGQRVWFWAEMLDNGMSGRWRCHDISLSFRRSSPSAAATTDGPPAKRPRILGLDWRCGVWGQGGWSVRVKELLRPESEWFHVMRTPNLAVVRASAGFVEHRLTPETSSRADDKRSEGSQQPVARTLSSALRQMSWNFTSRQDENPSCFACSPAKPPNCTVL
eukprot:g25515.t2